MPGDALAITLEAIKEASAPVIDAGTEVIESADVETLDLSALEEEPGVQLPEPTAVIELPAEVQAGGVSDELDAVLANIEVQDSYAATPTGDVDP